MTTPFSSTANTGLRRLLRSDTIHPVPCSSKGFKRRSGVLLPGSRYQNSCTARSDLFITVTLVPGSQPMVDIANPKTAKVTFVIMNYPNDEVTQHSSSPPAQTNSDDPWQQHRKLRLPHGSALDLHSFAVEEYVQLRGGKGHYRSQTESPGQPRLPSNPKLVRWLPTLLDGFLVR